MDQQTIDQLKEAIRQIHRVWNSPEAMSVDIDVAYDMHEPLCVLFEFAGITTRENKIKQIKLDLTTEEFNALTKTQEEK